MGMLKGSKHTEETRRKLSEANKGKPMHPNTRDAIRKANLGGNRTSFKQGQTPWNKDKQMPAIQNEKNYAWKGDDVSYTGLHNWVRRYLGTPSKCSECNTETAPKYEWANISKTYRRELDDWVRLCKPCHMRFDGLVRQVVQKDLNGAVIKVWDSAVAAEREGGFGSSTIYKCCSKTPYHKTYKGYRWEYV